MHDCIAVISRYDDDLVVGQHLFQLTYFGKAARPFGHLGQPMQFNGLGLLEGSPVLYGIVIVTVLVTLALLSVGSRRHQGLGATERVFVANLDTTIIAFDHIDKRVGAGFTTPRAAR